MPGVNLFKMYETDPVKEKEGTEIDIDGAVFVCRRAGGANRKFQIAVSFAAESYKDALSKDILSEEYQEAESNAYLDAYADSVVIDWRNVLGRDNEPWEFTKENFITLMKACPDVWNRLRTEGRILDNFRIKLKSEASELVGNESLPA